MWGRFDIAPYNSISSLFKRGAIHIYIRPKYEYLAIKNETDKFVPFNEVDYSNCKHSTLREVCEIHNTIIKALTDICEIRLFLDH